MAAGQEVKGHKICFAWQGRFANVMGDIVMGKVRTVFDNDAI
jgi:hypothetical protein